MKKFICVILSLVLILSSAISVSAAGNGKELEMKITPEKSEYAKDETIVFKTEFENHSLDSLENLLLWVEYEKNGTGLSSGITERIYDEIGSGVINSGDFKLSEERFASISSSGIKSFFARAFMFISKTGVELREYFNDFANLFTPRTTADLGSVTVRYDGEDVICHFYGKYIVHKSTTNAVALKKASTDSDFEISADISTEKSGKSGIVFGSEIKDGAFNGGLFFIDSERSTAGILVSDGTSYDVLAEKHISIMPEKAFKVKLSYNNGYLKGWVYYNPLDEDPYPVFDIYEEFTGTDAGIFASDENRIKNFTVTDTEKQEVTGDYSNPVSLNSPDPYIYYENGTYYLYSTNRSDGFDYCTSTDLIHWVKKGMCASKNDIVGEYWFWAPEVYKYNNRYYMLYSTEEHMALAVADSPCGPFRKTNDSFLFEHKGIDGHIMFDDDGNNYLYYSYFAPGCSEIWICDMDENLNVRPETNRIIRSPEGMEGHINEGPFVLKHNGYYYLTYSGEDYQSPNYSVYVAVSSSPDGPFVKQTSNPVLTRTDYINGTGHHCFISNPEGQLYIAYHSHFSSTTIHNRKLNIDKAKFVPTESGIDELCVYGPTLTLQNIK